MAMTADTVDTKPRAKNRPPLQYPQWARKKGIEGFVTLNILINTSGAVDKLQILESKPVGVFDQVAANFVKQWRFDPATYQGETVQVWSQQTIKFNLN